MLDTAIIQLLRSQDSGGVRKPLPRQGKPTLAGSGVHLQVAHVAVPSGLSAASSLHTTYVHPFRARYHHGDVQAGTTAAWLLRTLSPRSLPAWKGRCRSLSIPTRRQGACTTASRFGSAQPMVISGGFAVAIAPASGRFLGQTLSGSLRPRQEILATTSAKLS